MNTTQNEKDNSLEHITPSDGNVFKDIGFGEDEAEELKNDTRLSIMLDQQKGLVDAVGAANEKLKAAQKALKRMEEDDLPLLMDELGVKTFELTDGRKIKIDDVFYTSIAAKDKPEAADWLIKNGHSGMVKYDMIISFAPDESEDLQRLTKELSEHEPETKFNMHTGSIKAMLKELSGDGIDFPEKLFGFDRTRKAIVKWPK